MSIATMKALVLTDFNQLELLDVPRPSIDKPDDVLLSVKSVGICGSDLHGYTGFSGRRIPPIIMGHEATAEVVASGADVDLPIGTRVALHPLDDSGPTRRGLGMNVPGAYAEYVVWPARNLHPLPAAISYETGTLAEPVAVCVHAVNIAQIQPNDTVLIVGGGPIGLLTLAVLRSLGIQHIAVSEIDTTRLSLAQELGAELTVNPLEQDVRDVVNVFTDGRGVDISFEVVGMSATCQQTLMATRNQGTVIWVGNNQRDVTIDMQQIVTRELRVLGSYGMNDHDFQLAIQLLADGHIPAKRIINRRATLAEGPILFDSLLSAPDVIKCVFNF